MVRKETAFELGREAEKLASRWLEASGFEILDRNWRTRFHEIDIVASHLGILHFVEVKYRRGRNFGSPAEYVNFEKQRRIKAAAFAYINEKRPHYQGMQIDVIGVYGFNKPFKLEYIPNITFA